MASLARRLERNNGRTFLTQEYLDQFPDFPPHMNELGKFVYLRTYSRYLPEKGRRETWKETVARAVNYNINLAYRHFKKNGVKPPIDDLKREAERWFFRQFNLNQSLSGRTNWVGGAENGLADKYPLANFNCAFINIYSLKDLGDLFYLLLVGTGVGFKCTLKMAKKLEPVRNDVEIIHEPYEPLHVWQRVDDTVTRVEGDTATITVGDSKEGWVQSLVSFFELITKDDYIKKIKFNYNNVRPKGERLKTFGGTASGPQPLMEMFTGFDKVIKNQMDPTLDAPEVVQTSPVTRVQLRPIHILDMGNLIGANVVVGGVRRTAEIFIGDPEDMEIVFAKYGVNGYWKEKDFQNHEKIIAYLDENGIKYPKRILDYGKRNYDENVNVDFVTKEPRREEDGSLSPFNFGSGFYHRAMSNNSIGFIDKPDKKFLELLIMLQESEGEPGFLNLYEAARRRLAMMGITDPELIREYAEKVGLNPCAEILLVSYQVCNLTTVNVASFVKKVVKHGKGKQGKASQTTFELDLDGLIEAQQLSAKAGVRMTLTELELPHWDQQQKIDRLVGTSLTGWKDAMDMLGYDKEQERELLALLKKVARETANQYANYLRIPVPLLVTTVKPEGTLSQVFGGVSSGLHRSHSPYFIRRIRINAADPLAKAVLEHDGWNVNPENGTPGETYEEKMANANTLVIDFPISSGAKITKDEVSAREQLETYFMFQEAYTEHNSSNTITVKSHEWKDVLEIIWENWDNFVGVSFLAYDGGTYQLPPYEKISKEQYEKIKEIMSDFNMDLLMKHETAMESELDPNDPDCATGACPIR